MAYQIVWTQNAKEDLEQVYEYLITNWSVPVADKFLITVLKRLHLMESFPFAGRASYIDTSIRKLAINEYISFYYKVEKNTITVLNIFDMRKEINPNEK